MKRDRIFFLSDVHLGVDTPEVERQKSQRLQLFFQEVRENGRRLYIVGDLFDFWFEYRHVVPRGHHQTLAGLASLPDAGVEVCYLAGNHDFAIGNFFTEMGISIVRDTAVFSHEDKRFLVYHGDGLSGRDTGYRIMKRIIRHPAARTAFYLLHPDLGFRVARLFSHASRDYTSAKSYGEADGMQAAAEKWIREGYDIVVMGHRHVPVKRNILSGVYVNLGDWISFYTFALFAGGNIELFTMKNGHPEPYHA